jgi:hypothetical protein
MPLYQNALTLIRENLEAIERGGKVKPVAIGTLTPEQLAAINASRAVLRFPQPPVIAEILFLGRHLYNSRIAQDGYTIEDVLDQITAAVDAASTFLPTQKATVIQNHGGRLDRYGNRVQDQAIFECTARHPRPELLSVIPKGDVPPKTVPPKTVPSKTRGR